jgi:hypothetical protein
MRFFKSKQKVPIERALELVAEAVEIAFTYKRDKRYQPTEADLQLFEKLREAVFGMHATLDYICRRLEQRHHGEPEGAKKFTDPKVFDYHYPP